MDRETLVSLTADIVASHVANNSVGISDIGSLVQNVHRALEQLEKPTEITPEAKTPAVSVRSSIKPDAITCLVCGKKQKTLKRHLASAHGLTPGEYRAEFKLPDSYPMTAPAYTEVRRAMAKKIGLGSKPKATGAKSAKKPRSQAKPAKSKRTPRTKKPSSPAGTPEI